jgi:pilus assembly protein CpaE
MQVVYAHPPQADSRELRQILLGSGLDCGSDDCVAWSDLPFRLGRGDVDLVLVQVDESEQQPWHALQGAKALTQAPIMAVGSRRDERIAMRAQQMGISDVLDETNLREALDDALDRSVSHCMNGGRRGRVLSVFAPTAGSGRTTVGCNLAGALARRFPNKVALIELSRESGNTAVMLNLETRHTAGEVCRRWRTLDTVTLDNSFTEHRSGLGLLANDIETSENAFLDRHAVRRIAVLTRVCRDFSVLTLDSRMSECEVEAMKLSDAVVLVVRPDIVCVRRAYRALERAKQAGIGRDTFRLVINRYGQRGQLPLRQIEATLELRALVLVPDDPKAVNRALNQGGLAIAQSRLRNISRNFAALARKLNIRETTHG